MRRLAPVLVVVALFGLLYAARAGFQRQTVIARLDAAQAADGTLDYHGTQRTRLTLDGRTVESRVRVVHQAPDKTRLEYLDGQLTGTRLITVGDEQWRYDPALNTTMRLKAPGPVPMTLRGYRATFSDGPSIAGRPTHQVKLTSPRGERLLWLDRETNLVLGTRTRQGEFETETIFTELDLTLPDEPTDFSLPAGATEAGAEACSLETCSRRLGFPVKEPTWRPAGFTLSGAYLYDCPCGCGMTSAHLVYGNGVGWISLFYHDKRYASCVISDECCRKGAEHDRCVGIRTAGLEVVGRVDRQPIVVAVGDASSADLAAMAESVPAVE